MKILAILVLSISIFSAPILAQKSPSSVETSVVITNIESEYRDFSGVKPQVLNIGNRPIYLVWFYPHRMELMRLNEETGKWETGNQSFICGSSLIASGETGPLKLPSGEGNKFDLDWEIATDNYLQPKWFILDGGKQRPLAGRYKIKLPYSFAEWSIEHTPNKVYEVESTEFNLMVH